MKHLRDVMTRDVEMVFPHTTMREAAAKMKKLNIGMLPVCDGDRLTGILTDRDMVVRGVSQNCLPEQALVRDIMTHNVVYCYEDDPIQKAADLMKEKQIRRLVILDRNKKLCGIVSLGDLALESNKKLAGGTLRAVSESPVTFRQTRYESLANRTGFSRKPLNAMGALFGTAVAIGAFRILTKRPSEKVPEPTQEIVNTPEHLVPNIEQESHESGIVSPIKNEIVEEHARLHSAGDPAVRRINPSRETAGVKTIRKPFFGKSRFHTSR